MAGAIAEVRVQPVNHRLPRDRAALTALLDAYARDPMGGGTPLAPEVLARLCDDLAERPFAFGYLAWAGDEPVGLVNCFEGYSTFKARPLVNLHDIVVRADWRGRGVAQQLIAAVAGHAQRIGACKLTLEVLSGNRVAMAAYERAGFEPYALDPAAGQALLMQKWL